MGKILWSYWFFSDTWFFPTFFFHSYMHTTWFSTTTHSSLYTHNSNVGFFFFFHQYQHICRNADFCISFFLYILFFYSVYSFSLSHSLCFFFPFNNYTFLLFLFPRVKKRKRIENFMEIGKVFPFRLFILFIKIRWKIKLLWALTSGRKCHEKMS